MPEVIQRNIRIPAGKKNHTGHTVRTVNVSKEKGIKGLYCVTCKSVSTHLFARNKNWTMAKAKEWIADYTEKIDKIQEIHVDQVAEFLRLQVTMKDGSVEMYEPNTPQFILKEEQSSLSEVVSEGEHVVSIKAVTLFEEDSFNRREVQDDVFSVFGKLKDTGAPALMEYRFTASAYSIDQVKGWVEGHDIQTANIQEAEMSEKNKDQEYDVNNEQLEIVKIDKSKRLVYGVFLVPEKADHDGDVISADDIEKVAHEFMVEYRTIDEMHKDVIDADIVESAIAWQEDLDFNGKKLSKGTWFGAVKVHNDEVWEKIQNGEYAGFSVRISGIREPIEK